MGFASSAGGRSTAAATTRLSFLTAIAVLHGGSLASVDCPEGTGRDSKGRCKECPTGTFGAGGDAPCEECGAGQISTRAGASSCSPCPLGHRSRGGQECAPCGLGQFIAAGMEDCEDCPAGMYSKKLGSETCEACPPGSFSDQVGAIHHTLCELCQVGRWSSQVGASSREACAACPKGTWSSAEGASVCIRNGSSTERPENLPNLTEVPLDTTTMPNLSSQVLPGTTATPNSSQTPLLTTTMPNLSQQVSPALPTTTPLDEGEEEEEEEEEAALSMTSRPLAHFAFRIAGLDLENLTLNEKANLSSSLAESLALVCSVDSSGVTDMQGHPREVSLRISQAAGHRHGGGGSEGFTRVHALLQTSLLGESVDIDAVSRLAASDLTEPVGLAVLAALGEGHAGVAGEELAVVDLSIERTHVESTAIGKVVHWVNGSFLVFFCIVAFILAVGGLCALLRRRAAGSKSRGTDLEMEDGATGGSPLILPTEEEERPLLETVTAQGTADGQAHDVSHATHNDVTSPLKSPAEEYESDAAADWRTASPASLRHRGRAESMASGKETKYPESPAAQFSKTASSLFSPWMTMPSIPWQGVDATVLFPLNKFGDFGLLSGNAAAAAAAAGYSQIPQQWSQGVGPPPHPQQAGMGVTPHPYMQPDVRGLATPIATPMPTPMPTGAWNPSAAPTQPVMATPGFWGGQEMTPAATPLQSGAWCQGSPPQLPPPAPSEPVSRRTTPREVRVSVRSVPVRVEELGTPQPSSRQTEEERIAAMKQAIGPASTIVVPASPLGSAIVAGNLQQLKKALQDGSGVVAPLQDAKWPSPRSATPPRSPKRTAENPAAQGGSFGGLAGLREALGPQAGGAGASAGASQSSHTPRARSLSPAGGRLPPLHEEYESQNH